VESARPAATLIRDNLNALQIAAGFDLVHSEVGKTLRRWQTQGVLLDYVFLDPPYRLGREYRDTLEFLGESILLKPTTIVIAEHTKKFEPVETAGVLRKYRTLVQGDAALSFYRKA
jgi:16S rRNA G966 N2-methylase RsmD